MSNTEIIVLAAGKGTRMNTTLPKVLLPIHHHTMIDYTLRAIAKSDFPHKPHLVVGHQKEKVQEHLGQSANYIHQKKQLGTGHAVKITEPYIKGSAATILVLYGDHPVVSHNTISKILKTHQEKNATLTMATTKPTGIFLDKFKGFSRIIRNENNQIIRTVEAKDATQEELKITEVNPAYLCFNKTWLFKKLKEINNQNKQNEYYLTDLIGLATKEGNLINDVQIPPKEALGANTREQLKFLEKYLKPIKR